MWSTPERTIALFRSKAVDTWPTRREESSLCPSTPTRPLIDVRVVPETYFLGLHKSDAARQVMERENEVIRLEADASAYYEYNAMTSVMQTLAQSAYMRQSQALAEAIEDQFENRVGRRSRGVKQAGFYVLYGASMPSVLIELGFLSHPGEAAYMRSDDGQTYLASAIFRAIRQFKSEYDQGLHLSASNR